MSKLLIVILTFIITGCTNINNYTPPSLSTASVSNLATLQGFDRRNGGFLSADWINGYIHSIDNRIVSYSFIVNDRPTYQIPVLANIPHQLVVYGAFNQGWSSNGPFEAFANMNVLLKPGMHYKLNAAVNGAQLEFWLEDTRGNKVAMTAASYHHMPRNQTVPVFIPMGK